MKTEEEVLQFMNSELRDIILPLEELRIKKVRKIKYLLILASISAILIVLGVYEKMTALVVPGVFAIMLSIGFAYETLEKMKIVLQRHFKSDVLPRLLEYLFHQFDYIPNQRIAKSLLTESQLISDEITMVEGEDFMRFKHGETGIMFCETTVFRKDKSDGPIFKGIFLVASFNKNFLHQTVVLPKSKVSLINRIIDYESIDGFYKIKLEDVDFNREFAVYSTDQVEARYVLSTSLMSRILAYKQKVNRRISLSFVNNKMFCAIPNYINLFEPAIFESFFDFKYFRKSYEALKLYNEIVDDLNLNLRIWTKA